jgi:polyketide biosynthesis acyl carrier protein
MNDREIMEVIIRHTKEVIPHLDAHELTAADRLQDLGANSVDRAEIVSLVLESLSLRISRTELFGPNNIGELAQLLHAKMQR